MNISEENTALRDKGAEFVNVLLQVKLGGQVKSVTSIRNCEASLQGLKTDEIQMCLEAEASASVKVNVKAETKHCRSITDQSDSKKSFSDIFRDR